MKALASLILAAAALGLAGCIVAPVEPAPVAYAAAPPGVVYVPGRTYVWGGYHHRYYGGNRWRHWR
jgi:hypothetical protein